MYDHKPACQYRWRLQCLTLAVMPLSVLLASSQPLAGSTPQCDRPGVLAAAAINELLDRDSGNEAFVSMMQQRRNSLADGNAPTQDAYPAWLAAQLLQQAAAGELFVIINNSVALRTTWDQGDDQFWYICTVSHGASWKPQNEKYGPWVLWQHFGEWVTPAEPGDTPWAETYALASISHGDVVELEIYRVPRNYVDMVERLNPVSAIEDDAAWLLLRLQLPVIVE